MKILVLGGTGMLGHKLVEVLSLEHDVHATTRSNGKRLLATGLITDNRLHTGIDIQNRKSLRSLVLDVRPDVVLNAVGLIKQDKAIAVASDAIEINALFPHVLSELCEERGAKLILFSTDCVFDGKTGGYDEADLPNAVDLYGRSKALGEVVAESTVVLRTSIIGRELVGSRSLVEWVISNKGGSVSGYSKAIYSGLTTVEMARVVKRIIESGTPQAGIWNVSSDNISKLEILRSLNEEMKLGIDIARDDVFSVDRSLDSTQFRAKTEYKPPSWAEMIRELAEDADKYETWRKLTF